MNPFEWKEQQQLYKRRNNNNNRTNNNNDGRNYVVYEHGHNDVETQSYIRSNNGISMRNIGVQTEIIRILPDKPGNIIIVESKNRNGNGDSSSQTTSCQNATILQYPMDFQHLYNLLLWMIHAECTEDVYYWINIDGFLLMLNTISYVPFLQRVSFHMNQELIRQCANWNFQGINHRLISIQTLKPICGCILLLRIPICKNKIEKCKIGRAHV